MHKLYRQDAWAYQLPSMPYTLWDSRPSRSLPQPSRRYPRRRSGAPHTRPRYPVPRTLVRELQEPFEPFTRSSTPEWAECRGQGAFHSICRSLLLSLFGVAKLTKFDQCTLQEKLFGAAKLLDKQIFPLMKRKEMYKAKFEEAQTENDYLTKQVDSLREEVQRLQVDKSRILRLEQEKAELTSELQVARNAKSELRRKLKRLQESAALEKEALGEKLEAQKNKVSRSPVTGPGVSACKGRRSLFGRQGSKGTRPKRWRNSLILGERKGSR